MFARILVGVDGSEAAERALARALDLAALCGSELFVVSAEERLPAYAVTVGEIQEEERYEHRYYRRIQHEARRQAEEHGVPVRLEVVPGHPAQVLVRVATEHGCDLIVLGHTGHSGLHHLFLGSTADRVVEHARCAVLVVR
jgi:nucleotide-binding universal stress UspA family protein